MELRFFLKSEKMREGKEKVVTESSELLGFSHPLRLNIVIAISNSDATLRRPLLLIKLAMRWSSTLTEIFNIK